MQKFLINQLQLVPSYNERNSAIKTIGEFEGWKAPTKTENTNIELKQPIFGNRSLDAE